MKKKLRNNKAAPPPLENGKRLDYIYVDEATLLMDRIYATPPWVNASAWLEIKNRIPEFKRKLFQNGFSVVPYKK